MLGVKYEKDYLWVRNSPVQALNIESTLNLGNQKQLAGVYHILDSLSGLAIIDYQNNFVSWLPESAIIPRDSWNSQPKAPGEYLEWFRFHSLDDTYGASELLVQYGNTGTAGVHPFYLYSHVGNDFQLLLKLVEASSKVEVRDLDDKWPDEIVHSYSISGSGKLERDLLRFKDIWRLQDGKPIKVNHLFPQEYQELIDLHTLALTKKEWETDVGYYYPVLDCLKEKAGLTMQGELVSVKDCEDLLKKRYEQAQD